MPTSTDHPERQRPGARTSPPPAAVPGNSWTAIDVAEVGSLPPQATVSVVVSGPDPEGHVPLTLAALADQSYPSALLTAVVEAGDGEEARLREAVDDLALEVAAPGHGAGAAEGEVVLFVPAGSLPERELVEAHARWHHAVADAVSVGFPRPIDAAGLEPSQVQEAQRSGGLEELVAERLRRDDEDGDALEAFLERTHGLTERRPDSFRVAARGTVGVRAELLRAAGEGATSPGDPLARLDLAYRLDCAGCVFVPERAARTYAPYPEPWIGSPEGPETGGEAPAAGAAGHGSRAAGLIPVRGFRTRGTGRVFRRPVMVVDVPADERDAAEVLEVVDAVLRGRLSDLRVHVRVSDGHPQSALLEAACSADPRVRVGAAEGESHQSPYAATVPAGALPGDETLEAAHELVADEGLGVLNVTVPMRAGRLPLSRVPLADRVLRRPALSVTATGPRARARRVAAHRGEPAGKVLASLFGERRIDGAAVGLRPSGAGEPHPTENGPLPPASDLAHERAEHLRYRARAATSQARLDRQGQRLFRERLRSAHERKRADLLEARLARLDPAYWVRWKTRRVLRRLAAQPKRLWGRVAAVRMSLYRLKQSAAARTGRGDA